MKHVLRILARSSALLMGILLFFAFTSHAYAQKGAELFKAKCVICHGPDASGNTTMGAKLKVHDLHSPDVQKMTDIELHQVIAEGKNKMPAYEKKLSKDQIDSLVAYVREVGKKK